MNVKNRAVIRRLSRRTLRASKKRNTIAVLAIALTALLFTSLFTIALSLNESQQQYTFRQLGGCPHGSFKEVNSEQIEAISAHPRIKAAGVRTTIGQLSTGAFAKSPAEVSYMDENCTAWCYSQPTTGHAPRDGNEIAMDTAALSLLGVEPELGAQVTLRYDLLDAAGATCQRSDVFTLTGWWEYDEIMPVHFINVSEAYASAMRSPAGEGGLGTFRTDLYVMLRSSLDILGQLEQVDTDLGYTWEGRGENVVRLGVNSGYTAAQLGANLDAGTVLALLALSALILFTGYLIIYNIFQISVAGDIRYYGLLKTIGVTPRQLRRMIRQQALGLCLGGIPLGLGLGYGIGVLLVPQVLKTTDISGAAAVSSSPLIFLFAALFALGTVLLSCSRPGRMAGRVSPVEATRYTDNTASKRKRKKTSSAGVRGMALANLGRSPLKTALVILSLSLAVVLLNVLVLFVGGFDMETYLSKQSCADFLVSGTDYFHSSGYGYLTEEVAAEVAENTTQSLAGCGYTLSGKVPLCWIPEETYLDEYSRFASREYAEASLRVLPRRDGKVGPQTLIEGLDRELFGKLTVVEGDLTPLLQPGSRAIALAVSTDDFGHVIEADFPPIGSTQLISYTIKDGLIDSRTGEPA